MSVLSFFQWAENTGLALTLRDSTWAFAVIEAAHLLALAVIGGAVLLVDLRLLGAGLTGRPVRELAGEARPFATGSLIVLIVTGIGLFLTESVKCYYSTPFWVKMAALLVATLFTYLVRNKALFASTNPDGPPSGKALALISLVLWFTVAASGRWIGFSG